MPEGVRLVVSRRLARLGDTARKVLTAAAVIGRSFPLDLLSFDLPPESAERARVEELRADQERSRPQSHRADGLAHSCRVDEALPLMATARSSAERSGDAALLGYVLAFGQSSSALA